MELCEVDPAVLSATKAAQLAPNWWVALQTLGRSHLGLGELSQVSYFIGLIFLHVPKQFFISCALVLCISL